MPTLTLAIGANIAAFAQPFVADAAGLYTKYGVKVNTIYDAGTTGINTDLVSGHADVVWYTAANDLILAAKGQPVSVIYGSLNITPGALIGSPKIKTLADAKKLSSCKLATLTAGSTVYAESEHYIQAAGLHCTISQFSSVPLVLSAVESGNDQLGVLTTSSSLTAAKSTPIHVLVNPTEPSAKPYLPTPVLATTVSGLTSNLNSKRTAVVRFLKAIVAATQIIEKDTPAQIAQLLVKTPGFKGVPVATLTAEVQDDAKPYITSGKNPGFISQAYWTKSVNNFGTWGISGYSATNPANAYGKRVVMSFNQAAVGAS